MTPESEAGKFRRGESLGRPWGGTVACEPFPKTLYEAARTRGLETQTALAVALGKGKRGSSVVGCWYRGVSAPPPAEFGQILVIIEPQGKIYERLVDAYGELLRKGKGGWIKGSEAQLKCAKANTRNSQTPFGIWTEEFSWLSKMLLSDVFRKLGLGKSDNRDKLGIDSLSRILESAQETLELSDEQTQDLAEAIALTLEQRIQEGKEIKSHHPSVVSHAKSVASCKVYTGGEAGEKLGISREWVRKLRKEQDLPLLMTEDDLKVLKKRLAKAKKRNRKLQDHNSKAAAN